MLFPDVSGCAVVVSGCAAVVGRVRNSPHGTCQGRNGTDSECLLILRGERAKDVKAQLLDAYWELAKTTQCLLAIDSQQASAMSASSANLGL